MVTAQDVIRRSYIQVVTNTGVAGVTFSSKKERWMVLHEGSASGPGRLELYRKEDDTTVPQMVVELNKVTSVAPVEGKKEFVISFAGSQVNVACKAHAEVQDWISDINRFRNVESETTHTSNETAVYDAIPDDNVFAVKLRKSQLLTFHGACNLQIEKIYERNQCHISLYTKRKPSRLIAKWQIDHIRQYASSETIFKFESGSRSSTGVGWFMMETEPGVAGKIERAVKYWITCEARNNKSETTQAAPISTNEMPSLYQAMDVAKMKQHSLYDSVGAESEATQAAPISTNEMPSLYQAMDVTKMQQHSLYDSVRAESPANPSQGQYQAIHRASSSSPPQQSEYITLDSRSRENIIITEDVATTTPRASVTLSKNGNLDQYVELTCIQDTFQGRIQRGHHEAPPLNNE